MALSAVYRSHAVGDAGHSAAALAAAHYRLQHGRLPAKLADLLGHGLDEVPLDPFTGQPLRMKVADDGALVIYSIGPDGKDDGGAPYVVAQRTGDIPFRLPAKR